MRECAAQVSTAQVSTAHLSSAQLAAAQASSAHVEWLKWEKWLVAQVSAANLYITPGDTMSTPEYYREETPRLERTTYGVD